MQFYSLSDRGMLREINEDYFISENIDGYTVLILTDGMGGHNGGETASKIAGEIIFDFLRSKLKEAILPGQIMLMMGEALESANEYILSLSKKKASLAGMGTTADVLVFKKDKAYIAHVGDGRIYSSNQEGTLSLLTKDHSLVEYMVDQGAITREQAAGHPQKNVITKALGISPDVNADVFHVKASPKSRFLMCSDGLTNMLSDETIENTLSRSESLEDGVKTLINMANEAGGSDNITVILAEV